jgi:hypothetical protein
MNICIVQHIYACILVQKLKGVCEYTYMRVCVCVRMCMCGVWCVCVWCGVCGMCVGVVYVVYNE